MESTGLVRLDQLRAEELRQLPRGTAPQQVHLEEAVLPVKKTQCSGHVETVLAPHRRDPLGIPLDGDGGGQALDTDLSLEDGKAASNLDVDPGARPSPDEEKNDQDDG
jgi:hypothetical protein